MTGMVNPVYRSCRESAGMTQEQAAEALHCSVRSLARYEGGEQTVPDDVAYRMAVLYDSRWLAVQHLREVSRVAAAVIPAVEPVDLTAATLRIVNRVMRFAEQHRERQLMAIAEDGVITPEERPLFDEIMADLTEIARSAMELRCSEPRRPTGRADGPRACVVGMTAKKDPALVGRKEA